MAKNSLEQNVNDTTHIFDREGKIAICYTSKTAVSLHGLKNGREFVEINKLQVAS
jgi:hypothetical protein